MFYGRYFYRLAAAYVLRWPSIASGYAAGAGGAKVVALGTRVMRFVKRKWNDMVGIPLGWYIIE